MFLRSRTSHQSVWMWMLWLKSLIKLGFLVWKGRWDRMMRQWQHWPLTSQDVTYYVWEEALGQNIGQAPWAFDEWICALGKCSINQSIDQSIPRWALLHWAMFSATFHPRRLRLYNLFSPLPPNIRFLPTGDFFSHSPWQTGVIAVNHQHGVHVACQVEVSSKINSRQQA
jgi:hypothetical protein